MPSFIDCTSGFYCYVRELSSCAVFCFFYLKLRLIWSLGINRVWCSVLLKTKRFLQPQKWSFSKCYVAIALKRHSLKLVEQSELFPEWQSPFITPLNFISPELLLLFLFNHEHHIVVRLSTMREREQEHFHLLFSRFPLISSFDNLNGKCAERGKNTWEGVNNAHFPQKRE